MFRPDIFPGSAQKLVDVLEQYSDSLTKFDIGSIVPPPARVLITKLEADKAPFAKVEYQFDATPYLGVFSAATFLEPRLLEPRPPPGLEVEPPAR
eukprot:4946420-Heterocapsa_arctica.AAC.1